MTKSNS